eukprot:15457889-Alexandrium_andersonii.AAC.1
MLGPGPWPAPRPAPVRAPAANNPKVAPRYDLHRIAASSTSSYDVPQRLVAPQSQSQTSFAMIIASTWNRQKCMD